MKKMEFRVTPDEITIIQDADVNQGEYNATECHFLFSEEYENLIKKVVFFVVDKETKFPIDLNDRCFIPPEATMFPEIDIEIGICAYDLDDTNKLRLIYSPTPTKKHIRKGSRMNDLSNYKNFPTSPEEATDVRLTKVENLIEMMANYIMGSKPNKKPGHSHCGCKPAEKPNHNHCECRPVEKPHVHKYELSSSMFRAIDNDFHQAVYTSTCRNAGCPPEERYVVAGPVIEGHMRDKEIWYDKDEGSDVTKCRQCNQKIILGSHTHQYESYQNEDETITYTCICGDSYTESITNEHEHTYAEPVTTRTEIEENDEEHRLLTTQTCTSCEEDVEGHVDVIEDTTEVHSFVDAEDETIEDVTYSVQECENCGHRVLAEKEAEEQPTE